MRHIESCRTPELGGHEYACESCGRTLVLWNSCRDRHCPTCQKRNTAKWLETRLKRLLPTHYFHAVFTIPHELHPLVWPNKKTCYDVLFDAAAHTLKVLTRDEKHLGAEAGFTAVLHTWSRVLGAHVHLHCLVTGGGLARDGSSWVPSREDFFLPVRVLSQVFRGKFMDYLLREYREGNLTFKGSAAPFADPEEFGRLKDRLYRKNWHVYVKPPIAGREAAFKYIARYTHRVAISDSRIVSLVREGGRGRVTFTYRDPKDGDRTKLMTLDAHEFIRRFLLHVLPRGYTRIRHYGLLASSNVKTKLVLARALLGGEPARDSETEDGSPTESEPEPTAPVCPECGEVMIVVRIIAAPPRPPGGIDSS
jgi:DNA-directed RNA polymerase subunit RPC12/RpoP